jgi:hypothetical protein
VLISLQLSFLLPYYFTYTITLVLVDLQHEFMHTVSLALALLTTSSFCGCVFCVLQQTKCTATGFVIDPLGSRRILTNAHAVANQVAVKVRKHGSAQKFNARVLAVGHEVRTAGPTGTAHDRHAATIIS